MIIFINVSIVISIHTYFIFHSVILDSSVDKQSIHNQTFYIITILFDI